MKGHIAAFKKKGESGLPEITIAIERVTDGETIPITDKTVELKC